MAVAAGGLIMGKLPTEEARLRGQATIQARADAFARSMAGTIAELEREGITSSNAMAQALNARSVATPDTLVSSRPAKPVVKVVKPHEARSEFNFSRAASASASFWVPSEASVAPSTPHVS